MATSMTATEQRTGDWIETYSGKRMYPLDPREDEIHIEDIAHALALTNRFSGHTRVPYSVAEHSVRVSFSSEIFAQRKGHANWREVALWGLLHDAAEAYLNDLPHQVKQDQNFTFYRILETNIVYRVALKFGLEGDMPSLVKDADEILLATEARDLMTPGALDRWTPFRFEPQPNRIIPWRWEQAEREFIGRFRELTR